MQFCATKFKINFILLKFSLEYQELRIFENGGYFDGFWDTLCPFNSRCKLGRGHHNVGISWRASRQGLDTFLKRGLVDNAYSGLARQWPHIYGWNSCGRESLLDECHQNVCTLGFLTRSVLIKIAWGFW